MNLKKLCLLLINLSLIFTTDSFAKRHAKPAIDEDAPKTFRKHTPRKRTPSAAKVTDEKPKAVTKKTQKKAAAAQKNELIERGIIPTRKVIKKQLKNSLRFKPENKKKLKAKAAKAKKAAALKKEKNEPASQPTPQPVRQAPAQDNPQPKNVEEPNQNARKAPPLRSRGQYIHPSQRHEQLRQRCQGFNDRLKAGSLSRSPLNQGRIFR